MSLFKVCGVEEIGSSCLTNVTPLIESYNFGIKAVIFEAIKTGRDKTQEKKDTSSELKVVQTRRL